MQIVRGLGFAGALILSAIVGGTLIGSAFAVDDADAEGASGTGEYCEVFLDSLASELGVSRDELVAAGQSAANSAIDAAVAAGDLAEERAADLRERVAAYDGSGCGALGPGFARGFGIGFGHGIARGIVGGDLLEAAAGALGIERSELIDELRSAESLQAVAEERDASYDELKAAVLSAVQADLDAAVADGLEQERADAFVARVTEWLDAGGQLEAFGRGPFGGHPGHDQSDDDADQPAS